MHNFQIEAKRNVEKSDTESVSRMSELESTKEQLLKEHEAIKKRFDQLLVRERSAREEIRELKGKLLKKFVCFFLLQRIYVIFFIFRPILSARSDKSERSIKEQLQKKINSLENEIVELKENLARQISINESHRVKISQDFERWNRQKHYQQLSEKLKNKLKAKEADFEKLQETCAGYRILIERLEREKYNLENKIKNLKAGATQHSNNEIEILRLENMRLISENETLCSRLEMQQHHSGGLGAAMLQEKLEGQERKIAILELSAKVRIKMRRPKFLQFILTVLNLTKFLQSAQELCPNFPFSSVKLFSHLTEFRTSLRSRTKLFLFGSSQNAFLKQKTCKRGKNKIVKSNQMKALSEPIHRSCFFGRNCHLLGFQWKPQ
jgi:DNA repair exonuclease SbcCD ATPase subunit